MTDRPAIDLNVEVATAATLDTADAGALIDELLALYATAQEAAAGTDNDPLWVIGVHPSRAMLADALAEGGLVVAREGGSGGRLAGALILNGECAPGYEAVPWGVEATADEVAVVHLLAVRPDLRGRGLMRALMEVAADLARSRGCRVIRLDTLVGNVGAQRAYERLGLACRGAHRLAYGANYDNPAEPNFVLYEWELQGEGRPSPASLPPRSAGKSK